MRVFVTVGNALDPFERLLRMVDEALPREGVEGVCQHGVSKSRPHSLEPVRLLPRPEFEAELRRADVVVCHAGVGTLWSAIEAGHRPVVVPRLARLKEHVNDHQLEICRELGQVGLIVIVSNTEELARAVAGPTRRQIQRGSGTRVLEPVAHALDALAPHGARARPLLLRTLAFLAPPIKRLRLR